MAAKEDRKLRVVFLPYMGALGHAIPLVAIARLFAARGVSVTIITTTNSASRFQSSIDEDVAMGSDISVHTLEFPGDQVGLPEGIEDMGQCTTSELMEKVGAAIGLLQEPMEQLVRNARPDCIASDMAFRWSVDLADELHVPRLMFISSSGFFHCVSHSLTTYAPHEKVTSDTEPFLIPGLPDNEIRMQRSEIEFHYRITKTTSWFGHLMKAIRESERRSYGVLLNNFYEMEPAYAEHLNKVVGPGTKKRWWYLGPISLLSQKKAGGGKENNSLGVEENSKHKCLSWLDTQKPSTVLYACFGSMAQFSNPQLTEIALALETSGHPFLWVVPRKPQPEEENWLPEGFEERMKQDNKGMIERGWAPQLEILDHPAVGGFLSHAGWNSVQESITAGLPFISWPLFGDHFYNAKQSAQLLQIGVQIGPKVWKPWTMYDIESPLVGKDELHKAITLLMGSSAEAEEMRRRAQELSTKAKRAVEEGGSSYNDLTALIEELKSIRI